MFETQTKVLIPVILQCSLLSVTCR